MRWTCKKCGGDMRKPVYWLEQRGSEVTVLDPGQPTWECLNCGHRTPRKSRKLKQTDKEYRSRESLLRELIAKKDH